MNELETAINAAGGVGALAKALGIRNPNAISNWRARGRVPYAWSLLIRLFIEQNKQAA